MKTLNLSAVHAGLSSLRKLGHETDTFVSRGIEFKIRTITREELTISNEHAQPLFEIAQEGEDSYSLGNWIKQVQLCVLSFALIRVGDLDMEGVDYITDDTVSPPRTVQKAIFLRELLTEWEDSMISLLYNKFQELTSEAERKSQEGVKFLSKSPEEILEEKEKEVATLREELGLPPVAPIEPKRSPHVEIPPALLAPIQEVEGDVDVKALKQKMLQPVPQAPQQVEERDGYLYAAQNPPTQDYTQAAPQQAPETQTPQYHETPLSEEDRLAMEHERLYQERQERQQQREPLNQAPVVVRSDESAQGSARTANAPQAVQNAQFIPNPNGATLLSPSTRQQGEGPQYQANQKPRGKGNPNFYNPNRRQ